MWQRFILVTIIAYFCGNFSAGLLVSGLFHTNIREHGSGNTGATNMLRTLGYLPSILTLAGDCLKGVIACLIGRAIAGETGLLLSGLAVVVGHIWPVLYGFRGGKGISTSLGIILVSNPLLAGILLTEQLLVVAVTRYMSVASLISAVLYPVLTAVLPGHTPGRIAAAAGICALVLFSHRANLLRLIRHEENRLDFHKIDKVSQKTMENLRHKS